MARLEGMGREIDVSDFLDPQALFLILVLLLGVRAFQRIVGGKQSDGQPNPIEFWHFFASRGGDTHYGDPNKLGIMVGIVASTLFVGYAFWAHEIDNWYVVTVFALWLVFIAGTEYFAKWFRAFLDRRFGQQGAAAPNGSQEKKP